MGDYAIQQRTPLRFIFAHHAKPSLALCASGPGMRWMAEQSTNGYCCGAITSRIQPSPTTTEPRRAVRRVRVLALHDDVEPCRHHMNAPCAWLWWLLRPPTALPLALALTATAAQRRTKRYVLCDCTTRAELHQLVESVEFLSHSQQQQQQRHQHESGKNSFNPFCFEFPSLKVLVLNNYEAVSLMDTGTFNMHHIQSVYFSRCKAIEGIEHLGEILPDLKALNINRSDINNVSWLAHDSYASLHTVRLRHCCAVTDFSAIGRLQALTELDLTESRLSDLAWIESCAPSLVTLSIEDCWPLHNIEPVGKLRHLRDFNLNATNVDSIEPLVLCTALEKLSLAHCRYIHDFSPIGRMESLTTLNVSDTSIPDVQFFISSHLCTELQHLIMSSCYLDDYHPIGALSSLKALDMMHTDVDDVEWIANCAALEEVSLPRSVVSGGRSLLALMFLRAVRVEGSGSAALRDDCLSALRSRGVSIHYDYQ